MVFAVCVGIPGLVTALDPQEADLVIADVMGVDRLIDTALLERPMAPGEWVLIFHGFAHSRIAAPEANEILGRLRQPVE